MSRNSSSGRFGSSANFGSNGCKEKDKKRSEFANEIGVDTETLENSYAQQDRSVTNDYMSAQQRLAEQQKKHNKSGR